MNTISYYQNGIDVTEVICQAQLTARLHNVSVVYPSEIVSERFYTVRNAVSKPTVAKALRIYSALSGNDYTYYAEMLKTAEIGGYYFFNDESELPAV